jgi:hypothetical protein
MHDWSGNMDVAAMTLSRRHGGTARNARPNGHWPFDRAAGWTKNTMFFASQTRQRIWGDSGER